MSGDHPRSIPARFLVVEGGFAVLELMRETALAHVEIMPASSRVMPGHYFSASGHFAVMPGKV